MSLRHLDFSGPFNLCYNEVMGNIVDIRDFVLFEEVGDDEPDADDIVIANYPYPLQESVRVRLLKQRLVDHIPNISMEFVAEGWAETLRSRGYHEEADRIWPRVSKPRNQDLDSENHTPSCPKVDPQ